MKTPQSRTVRYYGATCRPIELSLGTWIEPEEAAYPNGGFKRRAYVLFPDGKRRVVRCSIPDTYFSIPAVARVRGKRIKGYITVTRLNVATFHESAS